MIYFATINTEGDTIETFMTDNPSRVQPTVDYHEIIKLDTDLENPIVDRFSSMRMLLNLPI